MIHLRIVAPEKEAHKALEILHGSPAVLNVVHLHAAAKKPDGDLILCDVAREEASVIIGDLKELEIPRVGSIAVEHIDTVALRRRRGRREGRARPAVRRGRLGGGRAAHEREHRALDQLRGVHGAGDADRRGRHPARPADPDRRRHGGRPGVRPARRALGGARPAPVATSPAARSPRSASGFPAGIVLACLATLVFKWHRGEPGRLRAERPRAHRLHLEARLLLVLRRLRGGRGGDPLADERQVGRADRRPDLRDHDPGGLQHRRRRRLRRLERGQRRGRRSSRSTSPRSCSPACSPCSSSAATTWRAGSSTCSDPSRAAAGLPVGRSCAPTSAARARPRCRSSCARARSPRR